MEVEPKITFRGIAPSAAIEARIQERIDKLEQMYGGLIGCHVAIEAPHGHHHQGKLFRVRLRVTAPGAEIVAGRNPAEHHAHEDVYVALRDAFDAVERRLEDHARWQRGVVKVHEEPKLGRIVKLFVGEGYGFLTTADGREVYFHRNSVRESRFEELEVGSAVRFAEEMGEKGPQATAVIPQ
jgi:cold shock CspA family protein/ribosome-associated translation inhibitor RaiA